MIDYIFTWPGSRVLIAVLVVGALLFAMVRLERGREP